MKRTGLITTKLAPAVLVSAMLGLTLRTIPQQVPIALGRRRVRIPGSRAILQPLMPLAPIVPAGQCRVPAPAEVTMVATAMTRRSIVRVRKNVLTLMAVTLKQARMTAPITRPILGIDSQQRRYYAQQEPPGGPCCVRSLWVAITCGRRSEMHLPPAPPHHR